MSTPTFLFSIASDSVCWEEYFRGNRFGTRHRHLTQSLRGRDYQVGVAIEERPPPPHEQTAERQR